MITLVTAKFRKYTKLMFKCGNICHANPYQWNEESQRGELCPSKWQQAVWYLNVGLTAVYSMYLVGRGIQVTFDDESSNIKKVYIKFVLFYYGFPALFQIGLWVKKEDLVPFYCLNLTAIRIFEDHISNQDEEQRPKAAKKVKSLRLRPPSKCLMPKSVDLFFDFVWYGFLGIIPFIGLLNFIRPQNPEFISSVLAPTAGIFRWPIIFLSAIFQLYYVFTFVANAFVFIYLTFGCTIPALIALIQIKAWLQVETPRFSRVRVQRILDTYKSVQIIIKAYECLYCDLMVPAAKGMMICLCVFCAYGAIRMEGFLAVFLGAVGIFALGSLIPVISANAMFDTESNKILELMHELRFQNCLTLGQKKEVKSLHPIQLRMRRGYILDRECVKTVYQIVVNATVNLLVSHA